MEPLYTRYIQETFGPDGQVTDWHYHLSLIHISEPTRRS